MRDPLVLLLIACAVLAAGLWLFWPETGAFWRWRRARRMTERVLIEDALKHLHDCEYHRRPCTLQSIAGALHTKQDATASLLSTMASHEFVTLADGVPRLTPRGREYALHIIRAHRLWERYLADRTGYTAEVWHSQSEQREHELSVAQMDALAAELGHPRFDPHGDPIPTTNGELQRDERIQSLTKAPLNQPLQIVHLEDEPQTVYAQLLAEGIHLGMQVVVTERTAQRLRFWGDGDDHVLASLLANSISVAPIAQVEVPAEAAKALSTLSIGESGTVQRLSPVCQGAERRRLLDLGILPGTTIQAEMVSPSGDPVAYRIRGALIGLRKEQADMIQMIDTTNAIEQIGSAEQENRVEVYA